MGRSRPADLELNDSRDDIMIDEKEQSMISNDHNLQSLSQINGICRNQLIQNHLQQQQITNRNDPCAQNQNVNFTKIDFTLNQYA